MAENQGERRWIVEPPPAAGEVSLYLSVGEGAQLTAVQEAALSDLMRSLETTDAEVTGLTKCTQLGTCQSLSCKPVNCSNLSCSTVKATLTGSAGNWSLMGTFSTGLS